MNISKGIISKFGTNWTTLIAGVLAVIFLVVEWAQVGDFRIFLLAAEAMMEGKDIYAITYLEGFHYFYSPLFALLIWPLTLLPVWLACVIWKAMSILMLMRLFAVFSKVAGTDLTTSRSVIFSLILVASPVYSSFHNIQMSIFLMYIMFESTYQVLIKEHVIFPALLLGLAINIKIMPIVLLAYWVYRSALIPSLAALISLLLFTFLPSVFIGHAYNEALIDSWWALLNPVNQEHIFDIRERGLHGLSSLFTALFTDKVSMHEIGGRRHLTLLEDNTVIYIIQTSRALMVLGMLYFLRTWPFQKIKPSRHMLWEMSYLCAIIPLIFPHQQIYGFAFLLPASYYVVSCLLDSKDMLCSTWPKWILYSLVFFALLFINGDMLFGMIRKELWYFKVLSYGALALIFLLAALKPMVHGYSSHSQMGNFDQERTT